MKADSHMLRVSVWFVGGIEERGAIKLLFLLGMINTQGHPRWADGRGSGSPGWLPPGLIDKISQDSSGLDGGGHVSYLGKWMEVVGCFSGPANWTGLQSHPVSLASTVHLALLGAQQVSQ